MTVSVSPADVEMPFVKSYGSLVRLDRSHLDSVIYLRGECEKSYRAICEAEDRYNALNQRKWSVKYNGRAYRKYAALECEAERDMLRAQLRNKADWNGLHGFLSHMRHTYGDNYANELMRLGYPVVTGHAVVL